MRFVVSFVCSAVLLSVVGCTPLLQDPPVDMVKHATPETAVVPTRPAPPAAPPAPTLDVSQSRKRGWVPQRRTPAGDVIAGHAIDITPKAFVPETVTPPLHIPRAPKHTYTLPPANAKVRQPPGGAAEPPAGDGGPPAGGAASPPPPGVGLPLPMGGAYGTP